MATKFLTTLTLLVFVFLMIVGLWAVSNYYTHATPPANPNVPVLLGEEGYAERYFFQYRSIPIGDIQDGLAVS